MRRKEKILAEEYRKPLQVTERATFRKYSFPICPRCDSVLDREYLTFCNCCGQKLSWIGYGKSKVRKRNKE